jgi:SAM-dependent methyltransferase
MTHQQKIAQWIGAGKTGTEIGPGSTPIPGLDPAPIYVDCFKTFAAAPCRADYYGHACALPFHDHSLDYVLASHVLEHVANPIAALAEWYRVVRPGGHIYLIVPDRRATWEHTRELTPVDHMIEDFVRGTTAVDATHIDEFVFQADWSIFSPETPAEDVSAKQAELARTLRWAVENREEINIHFHTFEPSNLRELLERLSRGAIRRELPDGQEPPGKPGVLSLSNGPGVLSLSNGPLVLSQSNGPGVLSLSNGSAIPSLSNGQTAALPAERAPAASPSRPRFNWEIVDFTAHFPSETPNGVLAILRVDKGWRARAEAEIFRLRTQGDPRAVLREDAQPFAEWCGRSATSEDVP